MSKFVNLRLIFITTQKKVHTYAYTCAEQCVGTFNFIITFEMCIDREQIGNNREYTVLHSMTLTKVAIERKLGKLHCFYTQKY